MCKTLLRMVGCRRADPIMASVPTWIALLTWSSMLTFGTQHARAADAAEAPCRFVLEWGRQGSEPGEFNFPIGVAINSTDEVLITDFYNSRMQKFSTAGKFLGAFPVSPFPGGIAIDSEQHVYVAHGGLPPSKFDEARKRDKIAVFTAAGEPLREWGKFGAGDGEFDLPGGIAIGGGRVYVADQCNRRIQVFDTQGKFLTKWGAKGFKSGEFGGNPHPKAFFAGPTFLALDRQGNLFTTEAPLGRVQKFTSAGAHLLSFGDNEVAPGKFGGYFTAFGIENMRGPMGMCFDAQGRLWVNSIGGRIQRFSDQGDYLSSFGEEGTGPGQFYAPHGLAIDSRGCLYVVDAFNHRIQKFEMTR
jgi:tripartite motif-containing protein 71